MELDHSVVKADDGVIGVGRLMLDPNPKAKVLGDEKSSRYVVAELGWSIGYLIA